ncbi:hypothetical protein C3L33_16232, partial [Rhododendron williamsianum]
MAAIAGGTGCSAGLVFKNKESSCSNGVSVLQFNGIRAVENKQVGSAGCKPNGFLSTSGSSMGGLTAFSSGVEALIQSGYRKISPFFIPYTITNMGSALLAIDTGLMGPNYSISTACATANYCFFAAASHIRRGEADIIVAGDGGSVNGLGLVIYCLRALSQRNSEPTKLQGHGIKIVMALSLEKALACCIYFAWKKIMESLEHATKRGANIVAEYLGGAVTCDAYHMTILGKMAWSFILYNKALKKLEFPLRR